MRWSQKLHDHHDFMPGKISEFTLCLMFALRVRVCALCDVDILQVMVGISQQQARQQQHQTAVQRLHQAQQGTQ